MSVTSRSPLRLAGANLNSGNVNTGEENLTFGGTQKASVFSGMASGAYAAGASAAAGAMAAGVNTAGGADGVIFSGAGRLKDVMTHQAALSLSGQSITFYDSAIPTSGGPFAASGHVILAVVPGPFGVSGQFAGQTPYAYDIPFNSGLAVNVRSGQPGFTVTFIPETNPTGPFVG